MSGESATPRYWVRLSVPRIGGLRAWGLAEGDFERRLAMQASAQRAAFWRGTTQAFPGLQSS